MRPSYSTNDPKGWMGDPRRGAALGRPTIAGSRDYTGKLYLSAIQWRDYDYDVNGTYFGFTRGTNIFWCASPDGTIDRMYRATSREDAKRQVLADYPNARFFR